MKKLIITSICLLGLSINSLAQHMLHGMVLSQRDSLPLAGVTIIVQHSNNQTATNKDGRFRLSVDKPSLSLRVSTVGFRTMTIDVEVSSQSPLVIYLTEQAELLKEVTVSTGYQHLSRERAVGSFSHIDNELFNQQVGTDVISRLEAIGNSISVNRNSSVTPKLMVRGLSTINGPQEPLIVLDNFPYEGDLSNINPNDVEDITILKDAAAASIWGTRAGNGVIVITTKRGKQNQPVSIDFSANLTLTDRPDFGYLSWINAADYIELEKFLFEKGYYDSDINSRNRPVLSPVVDLLAQRATASTNDAAVIDARIEQLKAHDVRDDFIDHLYGIGINQQYALGLRGGSDRMAWSASAGYDQNKGNLADRYNRMNLRFANSFQISSRMDIATGLYLTETKRYVGKPSWEELFSGSAGTFPYAKLTDEHGNPLSIPRNYRQSFLDTVGNEDLLDWQYFPLDDYKHIDRGSSMLSVVPNASVTFKPLHFLTMNVRYQYELQQTDGQILYGPGSYFVRNLINNYTSIDPQTNESIRNIPSGGIRDASTSRLTVHNVRGQINYNQQFVNHVLSAMLGGETREIKTISNGYRLYGYDGEILTYGSVDYRSTFPQFVTGSRLYIPDGVSANETLNRYISFYGNFSYSFENKYSLYASARNDASNLFGVKTNDKWKPLWSIGLGWDIASERFFPWQQSIPGLKLRLSYGYSGNADQTQTAVTTMSYGGAVSPFTGSPYAQFRTYGNPQLRWETVGTVNLGLDFRLFGNHIYGTVEYFKKNASDLFAYEPIDITAGVGSSIVRNVGGMQAEGVDIELNTAYSFQHWRWRTHLNLNFYKDRITNYYRSSDVVRNFVGTAQIPMTGIKGMPVYSVLSYPWAGLDANTGDPLGELNGEISKDYQSMTGSGMTVEDLIYHGTLFPKWFGSMGHTISYRKIALAFRLQYKFGNYFRRESLSYSNLFVSGKMNNEYVNRWQKPGDELHTDVPSLLYPNVSYRDAFYNGAEVNVLKGDYIRLQYVNLSYEINLPERFAKTPASFQFFANVSNIGLIWRANKYGLDPEYKFDNSLKPSKEIAMGCKLKF